MYNPTRQQQKGRRRPQLNPHAGTKHSDIMRRQGAGRGAPSVVNQSKTPHGFGNAVFECDGFTVRYETMFAGNNTGMLVNEDGDRTIRVLSGVVFLLTEEVDKEGKATQHQTRIAAGQHINAARGTRHAVATSGTTDVELLFIETPGYLETATALSAGVGSIPEDAVMVPPEHTTPARRASQEKAQAQAELIQKTRQRRRAPRKKTSGPFSENANSAAAMGVKPRPSGPPPEE